MQSPKVNIQSLVWARSLKAAEGYLELGLLEQANAALACIPTGCEAEISKSVLLGQIQARQYDFEGASRSFDLAAEKLPANVAKQLWEHVAKCFQTLGSEAYAELALRKQGMIKVMSASSTAPSLSHGSSLPGSQDSSEPPKRFRSSS